ncbi:hypothetical protein MesoLj131c_68450 (plasmid) [Mesorhizobium sp. 131-3-5]|uniref:aldolase/citrate lyase family protein n=1 Tax=Mesorhizobium sp. 131-3-5 TaxID=2744520 RepID=UPI001936A2AF|nr:aldolase/citrate lyase family protein [Mesorhizobium sp. 131-3-5]BCH12587.1 hypothetical protein MesoLj131c_68450 [Mesorhizobium sp. 131-3-5]
MIKDTFPAVEIAMSVPRWRSLLGGRSLDLGEEPDPSRRKISFPFNWRRPLSGVRMAPFSTWRIPFPRIEIANAVSERLAAIASAHPRMVAMTLGPEDFSAAVGGTPEFDLLLTPNLSVLFAARAAGLSRLAS